MQDIGKGRTGAERVILGVTDVGVASVMEKTACSEQGLMERMDG
jgi:hypothetical protein